MFKRFLALILPFVITACTQASLAVVNLPSRFDSGEIVRDVPFGDDPTQKLDIYIPAHVGHDTDVVVFLYGGRWTVGAKEDYRFVGTTFAKQGFVTVIPDYRKYPDVHFPVFVNDSAKALAWVYDHIAFYNGKPGHIYLVGHSAGAHIGALLATDARYLAAEGKKRNDVIHGFIGLAGPYAFTPDEPDLEDMFGPPAHYPNMQATTFVDGTQPPMLLLHGKDDDTVKLMNLEKLAKAIQDKGGQVQTVIYPDTDHTSIMRDLTWLGNSSAPVRNDIVKYMKDIDGQTVTEVKPARSLRR